MHFHLFDRFFLQMCAVQVCVLFEFGKEEVLLIMGNHVTRQHTM